MEQYSITSLDDFCSEIVNASNPEDCYKVLSRTSPEVFTCNIHIVGDGYNANITGPLIQGLYEFQTEFFRALAFASSGKDDLRSLKKDNLWVSVKVDKGSTTLSVAHPDLWVAAEIFKTMSVYQQWAVMAFIALAFAGFLSYKFYAKKSDAALAEHKADLEAQVAMHKADLEAKKDENIQQANQEMMSRAYDVMEQVVATLPKGDSIIKASKEYAEIAVNAIVRNAHKAEWIDVGMISFDEDEINAIQSPETLPPVKLPNLTGRYKIVQLNTENHETWKLQLKSVEFGEKINATMDIASLFVDMENANKLFDYQKNETELEVVMTGIKRSSRIFYVIDQIKIVEDN